MSRHFIALCIPVSNGFRSWSISDRKEYQYLEVLIYKYISSSIIFVPIQGHPK